MKDITKQCAHRWVNVLCLLLLIPRLAHAVSILPEQANYVLTPGAQLDLIISFSEPVPNGLQGYALKVEFPQNVLSVSAITPTPELDFGLITGKAEKDAGSGFATVAGYTELGAGPYSGLDFVTFSFTVPLSAPPGNHSITLGLLSPNADNFVDGADQSIDSELSFNSVNLNIATAPVMENISIAADGETLTISFNGTPGHVYLLEYAPSLHSGAWSSVQSFAAPEGGQVQLTRPAPVYPEKHFYRINDQIVSP